MRIDRDLPIMPLRAANGVETMNTKEDGERLYLAWNGESLVTGFDLFAAEYMRRYGLSESDARHRACEDDRDLYDLSERLRRAVVERGMHLAGLPRVERQAVERFLARLGAAEEYFAAADDAAEPSDPFAKKIEDVLRAEFDGDRTRYADAMRRAFVKWPELGRAYLELRSEPTEPKSAALRPLTGDARGAK